MTHVNLIREDVENAAYRVERDASTSDLARAVACDDARVVPLRSRRGHYEAIPISGGWSSDPWDFGARNAKDLKRDAERFRHADAVGVILPNGQRFLLHPSTRRLVKFVEFLDGTFGR